MIGIFDSGIGGLTVLKELQIQLPEEDYLYIADSAFTPYGNKTSKEIVERCFFLVDQLIARGAEIILVACNTATAIAINDLRKTYEIPIVAMEPAVKPAVEKSGLAPVGILATEMTLSSRRYSQLLERFASQANVIEQACPGLVEKIELMQIDHIETEKLLQHYIQPMLKEGIDTIVLGCTHYPILSEKIRQIVGSDVRIIDTAKAVINELKAQLNRIEKKSKKKLKKNFYTSGSVTEFQSQLNCYWNKTVKAYSLKDQ